MKPLILCEGTIRRGSGIIGYFITVIYRQQNQRTLMKSWTSWNHIVHRTTYFRWREQAFEAVGSILWGYEGESERVLKLVCEDYVEK